MEALSFMPTTSTSALVRSFCTVLCGNGTDPQTTTADIETNLGKAEALRQAILKKAFAGELVPQDPADPPASTPSAPKPQTPNAKPPAHQSLPHD